MISFSEKPLFNARYLISYLEDFLCQIYEFVFGRFSKLLNFRFISFVHEMCSDRFSGFSNVHMHRIEVGFRFKDERGFFPKTRNKCYVPKGYYNMMIPIIVQGEQSVYASVLASGTPIIRRV